MLPSSASLLSRLPSLADLGGVFLAGASSRRHLEQTLPSSHDRAREPSNATCYPSEGVSLSSRCCGAGNSCEHRQDLRVDRDDLPVGTRPPRAPGGGSQLTVRLLDGGHREPVLSWAVEEVGRSFNQLPPVMNALLNYCLARSARQKRSPEATKGRSQSRGHPRRADCGADRPSDRHSTGSDSMTVLSQTWVMDVGRRRVAIGLEPP
jgi:hypothetical protein